MGAYIHTVLREGDMQFLKKNSYLDFIGSVGLGDIFRRHFVGEKRCPKRSTATPTIHLPVAVDLGWASRDDLYGVFFTVYAAFGSIRVVLRATVCCCSCPAAIDMNFAWLGFRCSIQPLGGDRSAVLI